MISAILTALVRFRAEATPETFEVIFGDDGSRLWELYKNYCRGDVVEFYMYLPPGGNDRTLFEAHLAAQLPPTAFDSPRCVECGAELSSEDVEAGEEVCLDCAAAVVLAADIEHEPGSLTATVRVEEGEAGSLLATHNLYDSEGRAIPDYRPDSLDE